MGETILCAVRVFEGGLLCAALLRKLQLLLRAVLGSLGRCALRHLVPQGEPNSVQSMASVPAKVLQSAIERETSANSDSPKKQASTCSQFA